MAVRGLQLDRSTRNIRSFGIDDDENARGPRYGTSSSSSSQLWHFGPSSRKDEVEADLLDGDVEEYYVNPLPLPLEEDISVTKFEQAPRADSRTVSRMSQSAAR